MLMVHKDENDAITLGDDGMLTADEVAAKSVVRASSELAGVAGDLNIKITNPITKITFWDGETALKQPVILAGGQVTGKIVAAAEDKDGEMIKGADLRGNNFAWSTDDAGVATVTVEMKDKKPVDNGANVMITGKGTGEGSITASIEGVEASITVSVTGQQKTRRIAASLSDNGNTFTWDRGKDSDSATDGIQPAWDPENTTFQVTLYDIISGDLLDAGTVKVKSSRTAVAMVSDDNGTAFSEDNLTIAGGVGLVRVTPAPTSPDTDQDGDTAGTQTVAEGTATTVVTLTSTGADPVRILFTRVIKDAPEEEE